MLKSVLSLSLAAIFTIVVSTSLSQAYYVRGCQGDYPSFSISRLERIAENTSALRNERIEAIRCLSEHGTEGARILSNILERDKGNADMTFSVVDALGFIKDRNGINTLYTVEWFQLICYAEN